MLTSVYTARQRSILHPEQIVGKPEGIRVGPISNDKSASHQEIEH
jgi:hypothetical protein